MVSGRNTYNGYSYETIVQAVFSHNQPPCNESRNNLLSTQNSFFLSRSPSRCKALARFASKEKNLPKPDEHESKRINSNADSVQQRSLILIGNADFVRH